MEKLVLIDGNSLINRAFYAMPILSNKNGDYTNAVFGFTNMFIKMIGEVKPTYVAVAFDVHAPTFRHKMYSEYKGTRKPMPEELRPQIPLLKEVLQLMGVCILEKEGYEADDIIGSVAKSTDIKTVIYTGDRDSFQLVDDNTSVYFTKRGITDIDELNSQNFKEKTGIEPSQIIDLKALMGDSSDNILGVSGVGEKTALSLIQEYGTIENLYNNTDRLTGKLQEKIINGKESAFFSKTLATIDTECGIYFDKASMQLKLPFSRELKEKFIELEFKALIGREDLYVKGEPKKETSVKKVNVENAEELDKIPLTYPVSLVVEDSKINLYDGKETEYEIQIPRTLLDSGIDFLTALKKVFSVIKGKTLVFSKKEIKHTVNKYLDKITLPDFEDLSLIKYLADFRGREESIKDVIESNMLDINYPAYSQYQAYLLLKEKLISLNMQELYEKVELPLSDVLFEMENAGFKVEKEELNKAGQYYKNTLIDLEKQIKSLVEEDNFNVNSPKQLGEILFEKLKIGKGKKTKTGYSTSAEVLEEYEDTHPVIPLILKYRQIQKLQSTYIEGFKPLIDDKTGLVHTSFNQTVTATGRLSSSEPNLQNIPVRDDEAREIRKFFVPKSDDRILISADYSQIELRLLSAFSKCQDLIDAFNQGEDVHSQTASKVFNVPLKEVTPKMRREAKAVNFGIIYGISEYGLAKNLKTTPQIARGYINSYFERYAEVKTYLDGLKEFAKKTGYAETILGRKRFIKEINSGNFNLRSFGERVAMNMPLQGSSADIIKIAMINVSKRLKEEGLKSELILQIHDELIIDAYISEKEQAKKILVEEMQNAVKLATKLDVEVGEGKTWYEAKS